jgi:hypothetical protein
MDKLTNENNDKINNLRDRYQKINTLFTGNFKKKLILYDDINCKLNEIEELLDNFELDNENDIELDTEIESRINENKEFKKLINLVAPYIILYQLNKFDNI